MLGRLNRYAAARDTGTLLADAAQEVGVTSVHTAKAYERWYRRERLTLADRPAGFETWRSTW
jgi:hypothetical protein